jgi:hypothetical protein
MFLREGLDDPNHAEIAAQIEIYAQRIFSVIRHRTTPNAVRFGTSGKSDLCGYLCGTDMPKIDVNDLSATSGSRATSRFHAMPAGLSQSNVSFSRAGEVITDSTDIDHWAENTRTGLVSAPTQAFKE